MTKLNPKKYKNALFIFPHPDDEILSCGALIKLISQHGQTTLFFLTKGERGNDDAHFDKDLKKIRSEEAKKVAEILEVGSLIHEDLGDGQLSNKLHELKKKIIKVIEEIKPDLLVTFDESGLYGHPDHITTSIAVTDALKNSATNAKLFYISFNPLILKFAHLPVHMSKNEEYQAKMTVPTHSLFAGRHIFSKNESI